MSGTSIESPSENRFFQYIIIIIGLFLTILTPAEILSTGFTLNLRIFFEVFFGPFLLLWALNKIQNEIQVEKPVKLLSAFWGMLFFTIGMLGVIDSVFRLGLLGIYDNVLTYFLLVYGPVFFLFVWRKEVAHRFKREYLTDIPLWQYILYPFFIFMAIYLLAYLLGFVYIGKTIVGIEIILETLRNSLFTGSIYILLGIGLTLTYKILNFANFSHGELIVTGPYTIVFALPSVIAVLDPLLDFINSVPILEPVYSTLEGIPIFGTIFTALEDIPAFGSIITIIKSVPESFYVLLIVDLIVTFIISGLLALTIDYLVFRPLRARKATPMTLMIASIGVSFIIRALLSNTYGTIQRVLRIENQPRLNEIKIIVIILALFFAVVLDLIIRKTKLGKAMRAMADNPDLAQASGISKGTIIAIVWIIGAGFAGMGGALKFLANTPLTPTKGFLLLLPTFAVIILGGIGSYRGTIIAAYIVGLAENFGSFLLTQLRTGTFNQIFLEIPILLGNLRTATFRIEPSFKAEYQIAIGFLILVMVLLIKPSGLFGEESAKDR